MQKFDLYRVHEVFVVIHVAVLIVACVDAASSEDDGQGKLNINYEHVIVNVVSFLHATITVLVKPVSYCCATVIFFHCAFHAIILMPVVADLPKD